MTYRVGQWTTGNVGERAERAITTAPHLELVGCCGGPARLTRAGRASG
jgi:hypothetical protein